MSGAPSDPESRNHLSENVVVITFPTHDATHEALTAFRNASGDWTLDEVLDALDAQQDAAEEASRAAHKALKGERHEERKASREERLDKLKATFHHGDDT